SPLLPLIPSPDRLGQIELLTTLIRKSFSKRPRGCWLAEYAWEPALAATLQTCGFDYSFLPERHFRSAGLGDGALGEPAITEDQGKSLVVFPVFDAIESFVAPKPPLESLEELKTRLGDLPLYTIFYPGEIARSLWKASGLESPDVFFERSFAALQKEGLSIEMTTPYKYLKSMRRFAKAYFQTGASARLLRQSNTGGPESGGAKRAERHPSSAYSSPDPYSGSSRSILLRHEESHALYSKMHYVRILVGQLRGDKSRKKTAQEELWKGQCGDAYWLGSSGGIYDLPVRAAAYAALIEAERTTRIRGSFASGVIRADIDFDGEKEILYQGADLNAYVQLRGASLAELDSFKTRTNYVNVMAGPVESRRRLCFREGFCERGRFDEDKGNLADSYFTVSDADRPANV
ncbi:MAG: DUF1925 domain-containing protein, partial [Spirochaetaceae bacterium]|nr:DUF1925 domain-containing protein [Spirochaetaceae bacterium]